MTKTVVAIGEILWDVFPTGKKHGGSSMNVALNLHKQGIKTKFISAVGNDNNGEELLTFLKEKDFPTKLIQIHQSLATSTVEVQLDAQQQATYTIISPVAWDEIEFNESVETAVKAADALVYCSLTCRNEKSRNTILGLLKNAKLKIFDINLRPPFYTIATLELLLKAADILKVNEDELHYLKQSLALTGNSEEQLLKQLSKKYHISIICLTVGEKGAYVLQDNKLYAHKGYPVTVADTVGAGDSFLATFIASHLKGYPMNTVLDRACKVGAFVASQKGANPDYGSEVFY
jgi:fructokinase